MSGKVIFSLLLSGICLVFSPFLNAEVDTNPPVIENNLYDLRADYSVPETENGFSADKESPQADSYIRYLPHSSLKAQPGKISIIESGLECGYTFKIWDRLPIGISLDTQCFDLSETAALTLPSSLTGVNMGIETTLPFFQCDKTYLRLKVMPSFYSDDWNVHSSGFRLPVYSFLIYQPDEKVTFLSGVAVYPDFEDTVLPIIGFIYKPNKKLVFNIVPDGPNISYLFNDRVTLFTEGGISDEEFEVDKDNFKNAVLNYKEAHLGCGVKVKVNEYLSSVFSSGYMFKRQLKYRDSLGKLNIKDNCYYEVRGEIKL